MSKIAMLAALLVLLAAGCNGTIQVLPESEQYWKIPAGTPFRAQREKDGPVVEVVRDKDTWAVDAGYLYKLQKDANAATLEVPE